MSHMVEINKVHKLCMAFIAILIKNLSKLTDPNGPCALSKVVPSEAFTEGRRAVY